MSEEDDDIFSAKWFRILLIVGVFGGAGGSFKTLTSDVSDRFKSADFRREIASRDARIATLEREVRTLREKQQKHLEHSAKYTEKIEHIETIIDP